VAVHGGSDDAERREAVAGLRAGRLDLVACAQLWIAGVDVPEIDTVIWLRPTQSLTAWLQGNGRGLRIAPGKRDLLILDHVGNVQRLDHPLFVHPWSLEGRVKRSREAALSVKVCPKCFSAMPSARQTCPDCGHQFTPDRRELQHVDGELVEVGRFRIGDAIQIRRQGHWDSDGYTYNGQFNYEGGVFVDVAEGGVTTFQCHIDDVRLSRHEAKREQGRATTVEELIAIGKRRGMKNPRGWARHVMAARETKGHWRRVA